MEKESTIIERFDAIKAWMEEREEAGLKEHPNFDSDPWFRHARSVFRHLEGAAFLLREEVKEFSFNPLDVMISQRTLEKAIVFEMLIMRFEKLMEGKITSERMVTVLFETAKSSVMSGHDALLNSTNPIGNVMAIVRNQVNCDIMKAINSSIAYESQRATDKA